MLTIGGEAVAAGATCAAGFGATCPSLAVTTDGDEVDDGDSSTPRFLVTTALGEVVVAVAVGAAAACPAFAAAALVLSWRPRAPERPAAPDGVVLIG